MAAVLHTLLDHLGLNLCGVCDLCPLPCSCLVCIALHILHDWVLGLLGFGHGLELSSSGRNGKKVRGQGMEALSQRMV